MSKVCIITGATDGIGKQTAFELAKKGFAIGLVGRNQEKGNDVLKGILDTTQNESVHFFRADLSLMKKIPLLAKKLILSGSPPCSPQMPILILLRTWRPFSTAILIN